MKITGLVRLGLLWIAGQKLVCINARYSPEDTALFSALLIEGAVYVVREPVYEACVHVIGIDGQRDELGREYGHHFSRFVELHGKKEANI